MSNESNSDRKPQLSGILTEPLNPRAVRFFFEVEYKKYDFRLSHFRHIKFKRDTKHLFKSKKNI